MQKRILITTFFILFFSLPAYSIDKNTLFWKVRELVAGYADEIPLTDKSGKVYKVVNGKQLAFFYSVYLAIQEAAELQAEFYVVDDKDPNAFATLDEDGAYMIAFTFGMLDMIGMDKDEAAAIIGHELAHLKLEHYKEREEAEKKNQNNTMFSAAATKYTRDNERESDYLGAIWAVEAGYDPEGAVRVQEKLYKLSKRHIGFSGSHPLSIERVTVLKSLARRLKK